MNKEQLIADLKAMSVLELAELVKALEEEFGVSAAAGAVVAAGPAAAVTVMAAARRSPAAIALIPIFFIVSSSRYFRIRRTIRLLRHVPRGFSSLSSGAEEAIMKYSMKALRKLRTKPVIFVTIHETFSDFRIDFVKISCFPRGPRHVII